MFWDGVERRQESLVRSMNGGSSGRMLMKGLIVGWTNVQDPGRPILNRRYANPDVRFLCILDTTSASRGLVVHTDSYKSGGEKLATISHLKGYEYVVSSHLEVRM